MLLVFQLIGQLCVIFIGIFTYKKVIVNTNTVNKQEYEKIKQQKYELNIQVNRQEENIINLSNQLKEKKDIIIGLERIKQEYVEKYNIINTQNKHFENKLNDLNLTITNLTYKLEQNEKEYKILANEKYTIEIERNNLKNVLEEKEKNLKQLNEMSEQIKLQFKDISNNIIQTQQDKMDYNQKNMLSAILNPLKIEIEQFKNQIVQVDQHNIESKTMITTNIENLMKFTNDIGTKADNLAKALKGDKKAQGNWGELKLKNLFEMAGLTEDVDYFAQYYIVDNSEEEDKKYVLDFVLNLPDHKSVIIDSKVSLNNYEAYCSCEDEVQKKIYLKEYCNDIKKNIENLGSKEYQKVFKDYKKNAAVETLEFIFMFLPLESAYIEALNYDDKLLEIAFKNKISIVTASSLMPVIRMIQQLWNIEKQNKNIEEIVSKAVNLYEKLSKFTNKLNDLGSSLDKAKKCYDESIVYLTTGNSNVIKTANEIKELFGKNKTKNKLAFEVEEQMDLLKKIDETF